MSGKGHTGLAESTVAAISVWDFSLCTVYFQGHLGLELATAAGSLPGHVHQQQTCDLSRPPGIPAPTVYRPVLTPTEGSVAWGCVGMG